MTIFGALDKPKINSAEDYNFFENFSKNHFQNTTPKSIILIMRLLNILFTHAPT
jgi:hypothetical protein